MATSVDERIERLSSASLKRVIEPEHEIPGRPGGGQLLPDELLSTRGLDLDLTPEQRAVISREEIASIATAGIRFEAVLTAGFALQIATWDDVTDPRVVYLFHEIGEESRHSRLFVRLVEEVGAGARNPLDRPWFRAIERRVLRRVTSMPALLYTLVLGGEEIPDLLQKLACEHPSTDEFVRAVNRYHRQEEARHLSFARTVMPEVWQAASLVDRLAVRHVAPRIIRGMFHMLVHPGVYAAAGLPAWRTWWAANRTPDRVGLRHEATRPVLSALLDAGVLRSGRIPRGWRRLCGVDRQGEPAAPVG